MLQIVGVADGDTLTGLGGTAEYKIRLHGVDAPEIQQDFGDRAKEFVLEACFGQIVRADVTDIDKYGRHVARIHLSDGSVLNEKLVQAGLAFWYEKYAPNDAILKALQDEAKAAKRGVWLHPDPVPPWAYRSERNSPSESVVERQVPPATEQTAAPAESIQVYVTRTGENYHRASCRSLSNSKMPADLDRARLVLSPCVWCRPPR